MDTSVVGIERWYGQTSMLMGVKYESAKRRKVRRARALGAVDPRYAGGRWIQ